MDCTVLSLTLIADIQRAFVINLPFLGVNPVQLDSHSFHSPRKDCEKTD